MNLSLRHRAAVVAVGCLVAMTSHLSVAVAQQAEETVEKIEKDSPADGDGKKQTDAEQGWVHLKDHWKACEFGGDGEITIKDGLIKMEYGDPITGVRWDGPFDGDDKPASASDVPRLPRDNYEVRWECRRDRGFDFVCAFTFPVADSHASFVMGGWGGSITGISSIDGNDASDNQTTMFKDFDNEKWYKAKVRVAEDKITVWIDGKEMFDHPREGHEFDIRFEMDPCTPLGIANFECDSQIRNVQLRRLAKPKTAASPKGDK